MTNYIDFMRKLDGRKARDETTNHTTEGSRPLDLQGIIEFTRGLGYQLRDLEERITSDYSAAFWAGYDGIQCPEVGLFRLHTSIFHYSGRSYQQQQRDTHSEQQDAVPSAPPAEYVRSDWTFTNHYTADTPISDILEYPSREHYDNPCTTVGSEAPQAQSREESESVDAMAARYAALAREYEELLRQTTRAEEGGVPSVRDEREGIERSPENTWESNRRRMERGEGR